MIMVVRKRKNVILYNFAFDDFFSVIMAGIMNKEMIITIKGIDVSS